MTTPVGLITPVNEIPALVEEPESPLAAIPGWNEDLGARQAVFTNKLMTQFEFALNDKVIATFPIWQLFQGLEHYLWTNEVPFAVMALYGSQMNDVMLKRSVEHADMDFLIHLCNPQDAARIKGLYVDYLYARLGIRATHLTHEKWSIRYPNGVTQLVTNLDEVFSKKGFTVYGNTFPTTLKAKNLLVDITFVWGEDARCFDSSNCWYGDIRPFWHQDRPLMSCVSTFHGFDPVHSYDLLTRGYSYTLPGHPSNLREGLRGYIHRIVSGIFPEEYVAEAEFLAKWRLEFKDRRKEFIKTLQKHFQKHYNKDLYSIAAYLITLRTFFKGKETWLSELDEFIGSVTVLQTVLFYAYPHSPLCCKKSSTPTRYKVVMEKGSFLMEAPWEGTVEFLESSSEVPEPFNEKISRDAIWKKLASEPLVEDPLGSALIQLARGNVLKALHPRLESLTQKMLPQLNLDLPTWQQLSNVAPKLVLSHLVQLPPTMKLLGAMATFSLPEQEWPNEWLEQVTAPMFPSFKRCSSFSQKQKQQVTGRLLASDFEAVVSSISDLHHPEFKRRCKAGDPLALEKLKSLPPTKKNLRFIHKLKLPEMEWPAAWVEEITHDMYALYVRCSSFSKANKDLVTNLLLISDFELIWPNLSKFPELYQEFPRRCKQDEVVYVGMPLTLESLKPVQTPGNSLYISKLQTLPLTKENLQLVRDWKIPEREWPKAWIDNITAEMYPTFIDCTTFTEAQKRQVTSRLLTSDFDAVWLLGCERNLVNVSHPVIAQKCKAGKALVLDGLLEMDEVPSSLFKIMPVSLLGHPTCWRLLQKASNRPLYLTPYTAAIRGEALKAATQWPKGLMPTLTKWIQDESQRMDHRERAVADLIAFVKFLHPGFQASTGKDYADFLIALSPMECKTRFLKTIGPDVDGLRGTDAYKHWVHHQIVKGEETAKDLIETEVLPEDQLYVFEHRATQDPAILASVLRKITPKQVFDYLHGEEKVPVEPFVKWLPSCDDLRYYLKIASELKRLGAEVDFRPYEGGRCDLPLMIELANEGEDHAVIWKAALPACRGLKDQLKLGAACSTNRAEIEAYFDKMVEKNQSLELIRSKFVSGEAVWKALKPTIKQKKTQDILTAKLKALKDAKLYCKVIGELISMFKPVDIQGYVSQLFDEAKNLLADRPIAEVWESLRTLFKNGGPFGHLPVNLWTPLFERSLREFGPKDRQCVLDLRRSLSNLVLMTSTMHKFITSAMEAVEFTEIEGLNPMEIADLLPTFSDTLLDGLFRRLERSEDYKANIQVLAKIIFSQESEKIREKVTALFRRFIQGMSDWDPQEFWIALSPLLLCPKLADAGISQKEWGEAYDITFQKFHRDNQPEKAFHFLYQWYQKFQGESIWMEEAYLMFAKGFQISAKNGDPKAAELWERLVQDCERVVKTEDGLNTAKTIIAETKSRLEIQTTPAYEQLMKVKHSRESLLQLYSGDFNPNDWSELLNVEWLPEDFAELFKVLPKTRTVNLSFQLSYRYVLYTKLVAQASAAPSIEPYRAIIQQFHESALEAYYKFNEIYIDRAQIPMPEAASEIVTETLKWAKKRCLPVPVPTFPGTHGIGFTAHNLTLVHAQLLSLTGNDPTSFFEVLIQCDFFNYYDSDIMESLLVHLAKAFGAAQSDHFYQRLSELLITHRIFTFLPLIEKATLLTQFCSRIVQLQDPMQMKSLLKFIQACFQQPYSGLSIINEDLQLVLAQMLIYFHKSGNFELAFQCAEMAKHLWHRFYTNRDEFNYKYGGNGDLDLLFSKILARHYNPSADIDDLEDQSDHNRRYLQTVSYIDRYKLLESTITQVKKSNPARTLPFELMLNGYRKYASKQ